MPRTRKPESVSIKELAVEILSESIADLIDETELATRQINRVSSFALVIAQGVLFFNLRGRISLKKAIAVISGLLALLLLVVRFIIQHQGAILDIIG